MTDLRSALSRIASGLRSTAIAADALKGMSDAAVAAFWRGAADVLPQAAKQLDSLATSPLTVLDALRDPEVRAGRVWIETEHHLLHWQYAIDSCAEGAMVAIRRVRRGNEWGAWDPCSLSITALDSPCRLVPAEGDGG